MKDISPLVCTHHIYMEEEAKPIRQPQRRLNPHLQEVVRAEVLKLLQHLFCETPLWHTSAISQPLASFRSCEMLYEIPKALKIPISQPYPYFAAGFTAAEPPIGTRVPFSTPLISQLRKWAAKMPLCYENAPLLRNRLSAAKTKTVPWHPFLNVINSTFRFKLVI